MSAYDAHQAGGARAFGKVVLGLNRQAEVTGKRLDRLDASTVRAGEDGRNLRISEQTHQVLSLAPPGFG